MKTARTARTAPVLPRPLCILTRPPTPTEIAAGYLLELLDERYQRPRSVRRITDTVLLMSGRQLGEFVGRHYGDDDISEAMRTS
jgi:hypothetical protein